MSLLHLNLRGDHLAAVHSFNNHELLTRALPAQLFGVTSTLTSF